MTERLYHADRSEKIWSEQHLAAFMAVASEPLQRALVLALETGQRQGDLLILPWSSFDGAWIRLRPRYRCSRATPCPPPSRCSRARQETAIDLHGQVAYDTSGRTDGIVGLRYHNRWHDQDASLDMQGGMEDQWLVGLQRRRLGAVGR